MRILEPILRHVLRIKSAFLQQRPRIKTLQNHIRRVIINTSELTEGDLLLGRLWRQQVQVGDCDSGRQFGRITETTRMRRVEVHHLREYRVKSTLSNLITNLSLDRINTGYTQIVPTLPIPSQLWKYSITQSRQFLLGWPPTSLKSDHNPVLCPLTQVTHHHSCIFFAISNNWLVDVCGFLKRQALGVRAQDWHWGVPQSLYVCVRVYRRSCL